MSPPALGVGSAFQGQSRPGAMSLLPERPVSSQPHGRPGHPDCGLRPTTTRAEAGGARRGGPESALGSPAHASWWVHQSQLHHRP